MKTKMTAERLKQLGVLLEKHKNHMAIAEFFVSLRRKGRTAKSIADEFFPDAHGESGFRNPAYQQVLMYLALDDADEETKQELRHGRIGLEDARAVVGKNTSRSQKHRFIVSPVEAWKFANNRDPEPPPVLRPVVKQFGRELVIEVLKAICP